MARRPVIIGIGEVLWDMLPAGRQLGGAPANFAYHARALGAEAYVVSRVGDDELGHQILFCLDALGLNHNFVSVDPHHPTGTVDVRLDEGGVPSYVIHENVAWDFLPQSAEVRALAGRADAVCYGTLALRRPQSARTITAVQRQTRPECLRVFDVNFRQHYVSRAITHTLLGRSNVVKLNEEEVPRLFELLERPTDTAALVAEDGPIAVAVTRGSRGSVLYTKDGFFEHLGFPAEVADTVGAGDAFTAALVMGLLEGHAPDRINDFANRLAAYVCSQPGATPPIPADLLASR